MIESKEEMLYGDPSKTFSGVNFVLLGFDLSTEEKIRSKLVDGGGTDVGRYGPDCSHVIVGKILYDDPICVAAREEAKALVTGLWVEHSFEIGMPVDPASIMYRPLRDLNGIPGAKSLIVCLTGYQRQDREDIMKMVSLMGANFSKPLIANQVTHLICYKFEGDKYELAKKLKKIKLVNHRWLEDCLRAWELLPEADYDKSGHELEMTEAQAKDSEDEAEDVAKRQHAERGIVTTPQNSKFGARSPCQPLMLKQGASGNLLDVGTSRGTSDVGGTSGVLMASEREITPTRFQLKETPNRCSEISGSIAPGIKGTVCSSASLNALAKSPVSENIPGNLASSSKTDWNSASSSASKFHSVGYSPKTTSKASLPFDLGHVKYNAGSTDKLHEDDDLNTPSKLEHERTTISGTHTTSPKETLSHPKDAGNGNLPEKRKVAASAGSSKLQKTCHDPGFVLEGALMANEIQVQLHDHTPRNKYLAVNADSHPSPVNVSKTVTPEIVKEHREEEPQTSSEKIKSTSLDNKSPETTDVHSNGPENAVDDATEPQHEPQNLPISTPGAESGEIQNSNVTADLNVTIGEDANSKPKPLKRKLLAKKTLGSRPSFGRGKPLNQKGSISANKKVSAKNSGTRSIGEKEVEDIQKSVDSEKLIPLQNSNVNQGKSNEMESLLECGNQASKKTGFVDNETEAAEDEENELAATVCKGVSGDSRLPTEVCRMNQSEDVLDTKDQTVISGGGEMSTEAENVASEKGSELTESNLESKAGGEKTSSANKRPLLKSKKKNIPVLTKIAKSKKGEPMKEAKCKTKCEKTERKNENGSLADRLVKLSSKVIERDSAEMEKENQPVLLGDHNLSNTKQQVGRLTPKSGKKSAKTDDGNPDSISAGRILKVKTEPVWFILSGHRLQRKEFQQVIRRLKGRLCRDTHQWSYQATHFIVPDPIRRTEKFFAAAASGRWILKTDYLSASNESGKFLAEEPYEWHKNGLSEDGAINLEAPRKWRLLREKTGHGAFYGMRIIIYGDCIVPPLDTLKRVIKAGDGSILATSPPYTRFLESGVDFAIVSPGMPRVDIWVQEFLRHEIPCVLADYLVEYVCKPGYPLDKHVQYNTHAWTEKSFKKLINSMNDIAEDLTSEDDGNADIPCEVCGSRDRGEVMLICGDEGGSIGCGIGTHIDCCDPPLQEIPKEDWLCSKCSSKNTQKKPRKLTSTSKKKR